MKEHPTDKEIKQRLQSIVARPFKYEDGDVIYGVSEFNNNPSNGKGWASGGKTFKEKSRAEKYYNNENPLRNPEMHDTVLYSGKVTNSDNTNAKNVVVDPFEETVIILTDITILDRRKPGEHPN